MLIPTTSISPNTSCGLPQGLIAYLRLTDNCQLDCSHCFTEGQTGKTKFIDVRGVVDFLGRLSKEAMPPWAQFLLHGGEPFLVPTALMFELYDAVTPMFKNATWAAQTNLTYKLTNDKIDVLEKICGKAFGTSWDKDIRWGTEKQQQLWEANVFQLSRAGHYITVMVCIDRSVIATDPRWIMEYLSELGVACVMFERLTNTGNAKDNKNIFATNAEVDAYFVRMWKAYVEKKLYKRIRNVYLDEVTRTVITNQKAGVNCRSCEKKILTFRADGHISGCPDTALEHSFGTIYDSVPDILLSRTRVGRIAHEMVRNDACYSCDVFDLCGGGCHVSEWDATGCSSSKTLLRLLKNTDPEILKAVIAEGF